MATQTATPNPAPVQPTPATAPTTGSSSHNSASLYVGELSPDVTEANLFEIFNQIGAVASIRVCRDAITRRSLGYAYVNFHNLADAERAMDTMNNSSVKGKPCRIMWSQRDPSIRKSGKGNIFIKNLDKTIDHKALYDTFSQFGQILSCKIELDDGNSSRGYGYIQFIAQDSADKAVTKVNGMILAGKKVYVGPFVSRKERIAANSSKKYTNIYINNVDENVSEEKFRELFTPFGNIKSVIVMKDDATGKSKGFGFINFETPEQAEKAVNEMNGKDINGKNIFVGRAQKKAERESELKQKFEQIKMEHLQKYQGVNLYIKNLEDDYDDDKLRAVFINYGTITSAKIMKDSKGNSKGFGFVCFNSPEEATRAVTEMNGKIVGSKPLYVALAQRKEVRRAQLEAQFAARTKGLPRMPAPMYNGAPVFYAPQPGQPFVYPGMMPRGRFPPGPYGQPMPNYVMVGGGRGGQNVKNAGRGGRGGMMGRGGRGGMKQQAMTPMPVQMAPMVPQSQEPIVPPNSVEEQKRMLGEKLYAMISKSQPSLAGKITGMILESAHPDEIIQLIESPESLDEKVGEAVIVLKEHTEKAK